jgi:hypothetical protein
MPRMRWGVPILVALLAVSCRTKAPEAVSQAIEKNIAPSNAEVLAYLEDKSLPVGRPCGRPEIIHLEGIEALSVGRNSIPSKAGPWLTGVSFIYNTSRARYAIDAVLVHQTIGAQRVFHELRLQRIVAV